MNRIEAKVAEIISDRDLVLNKGANSGIRVGMRFKILHARGAEIRDPDTSEVLGSVEIEKTIVKITSISDKFAVARTFRMIVEDPGGILSSTGIFFQREFKPRKESIETLRTNGKNAKSDLSPEESFVKIGDLAVQVMNEN